MVGWWNRPRRIVVDVVGGRNSRFRRSPPAVRWTASLSSSLVDGDLLDDPHIFISVNSTGIFFFFPPWKKKYSISRGSRRRIWFTTTTTRRTHSSFRKWRTFSSPRPVDIRVESELLFKELILFHMYQRPTLGVIRPCAKSFYRDEERFGGYHARGRANVDISPLRAIKYDKETMALLVRCVCDCVFKQDARTLSSLSLDKLTRSGMIW